MGLAGRPDVIALGMTRVNGSRVPLYSYPEPRGEKALAAKGSPQLRTKPTAEQLRLNAALMFAESAEEVAALVEVNHKSFDCVNVSTALGRLNLHGAAASNCKAPVSRALRLLHDRLLQDGESAFGARQLANSAHALVGLQLTSEEFYSVLGKRLAERPGDFNPQELAMAMRSLAVVGLRSCRLAEAVASEVNRRINDFNTQVDKLPEEAARSSSRGGRQ